MIAINDGNEFSKSVNEIYPEELELKRENANDYEATFLDLHLTINNGQITTKLYDKRNSYNFYIVRFPYKSSNLPSKMFFATIGAEILRICRANTDFLNFVSSCKILLQRMLKQGANKSGIKNVLNKMLGRHEYCFQKFDKTHTEISNALLEH